MKYKLVLAFLGTLLLALAACFLLWPRPSSPWAEITLLSLQQMPDGRVKAKFVGRQAYPSGYKFTYYLNGRYINQRTTPFAGDLPLGTSKLWDHVVLDLNPDKAPIVGSLTNSTIFDRLDLHLGEARKVHGQERLRIYDFTVGGNRYACEFSAAPPEPPR